MLQTVFSRNNFIVLLIIAAASCQPEKKTQPLPYFNSPDFTPIFLLSSGEREHKINHTIGHFSFENQDGKTISNKTVTGKIHVANFIFTSCSSICPKMTSNMFKVSEAFYNDSNVVLLSFSVTPWVDTRGKLREYKQRNKITNPNWHFLTGEKMLIYQLARQSYFAEEELGFSKDSSEFLHTEHLLLVDGSQRIRGVYNGTLELDVQNLIRDINTLKSER
jgi:protein SCO1/2